MPDARWKAIERRVSRVFGSERVPLSGSNSRHDTTSDSLNQRLYIEVKNRKKIPALQWWKKAHAEAVKEKKTPLIVLQQTGSQTPMVLCNLYDIPKIAKEMVKIENEIVDDLIESMSPIAVQVNTKDLINQNNQKGGKEDGKNNP